MNRVLLLILGVFCSSYAFAESCELHLAWGHSGHARKYLESIHADGIEMGCNSGDAGVGALKHRNEYWRFQRGSNGLYNYQGQQGTQNGGLDPVIFEKEDLERRAMKGIGMMNSRIGFVRLTQYHWLKLHQYASEELLGKGCSSVKLKFDCVERDLNDREYRKRMEALVDDASIKDAELSAKYRVEAGLLQRFELLKLCFDDSERLSVPQACGQEVVITDKQKIRESCMQWVRQIDALPDHSWETKSPLPRPSSYPYSSSRSLF